MEWITIFILNWLLFFVLVDWKNLNTNIWGGIFTVCTQLIVDGQFEALNLYIVHQGMINVLGSSLFFVLGPVFVIGVLFVQFHPVKKWAIVSHVLIVSMFFVFVELLLLKRNALEYINWDIFLSISVDIAALGLLSWVSIVLLKKGKVFRL